MCKIDISTAAVRTRGIVPSEIGRVTRLAYVHDTPGIRFNRKSGESC